MTLSLLPPLKDANDRQQFGGKSSGLAWLTAQGCKIPEGFVIPVALFDTHLETLGLTDRIQTLVSGLDETSTISDEQLQTLSNPLQTTIKQSSLSADLQDALKEYWEAHQQVAPHVSLAVRSSALSEDGQNASFAGQFDSILDVTSLDSLKQAVQQVWASTFQYSALRYGQHHGLSASRMAVIIQQQIDPAISGVVFTQNPAKNNQSCMLLECCEGLAEQLVLGQITPLSVMIDRDTQVFSQITESEDIGINMVDYQTLIQQLSVQALTLEKIAGKPLDIEWCIDKNHQLFFVQCRPMTQIMQSDTEAELELWSNANIAENFPAPVVPLLASFVPLGFTGYFRGLGEAFGIDRSHMDKATKSFDRLVGVQAGHLYYNLSHIYTVIHLVPGGAWLAKSFNLFTGAEGSPHPKPFQRPWYRQAWQAVKIVFHVSWQYGRIQQHLRQFEQIIDDYATQTHPSILNKQSSADLAGHLRRFLDIRQNRWSNAALADTAAMVCYAGLKALIRHWLPTTDKTQLHNDLLQGLPGLASARPVDELWHLSLRIRQSPKALALFTEQSVAEVMKELPHQAPDIWQALQEYLECWGFRYSGELMLTHETPAENPRAVFQLLKSYLLDDGLGPIKLSQQRAAERINTTEQILQELTPSALLRKLPLPCRARVFQRVLRATHGAIRLRERARMKQALLYTRLRLVCLAHGDQLTQAQVLDQRDDVFYMKIHDLIDLATKIAKPQAISPDEISALQKTIAQRRAEMSYHETLNPPQQMSLAPEEQWHPSLVNTNKTADLAEASDIGILQGIGACGGVFSGHASVLDNVTEIDALTQGSVLVTRQTDPGWAPVFFLVKGLIIERGGMLSHGAIIAREYGIPAVVGVSQATQLIQNGEFITVDGNKGLVGRQQKVSS